MSSSRFPIPQRTLDMVILQILSLEPAKDSRARLTGAVQLIFDEGSGTTKERRRQNVLIAPGCGNDGPWKAWKTNGRFSTLPIALGNRQAISTFPQF
jgi:hypothetical protein